MRGPAYTEEELAKIKELVKDKELDHAGRIAAFLEFTDQPRTEDAVSQKIRKLSAKKSKKRASARAKAQAPNPKGVKGKFTTGRKEAASAGTVPVLKENGHTPCSFSFGDVVISGPKQDVMEVVARL